MTTKKTPTGRHENFEGDLLSFQLVQLINLLSHLGHSVVVFLAKVSQGTLMLDVGFLQVSAQFGKLGFSLLVQLDLCRGGASGFLKTFS